MDPAVPLHHLADTLCPELTTASRALDFNVCTLRITTP
jgi:hypothetical protein